VFTLPLVRTCPRVPRRCSCGVRLCSRWLDYAACERFVSPPPQRRCVGKRHVWSLPKTTASARISLAYVLGLVMGVSQHEARLIEQLLDERRSCVVVCHIGRGKPSRARNPHPLATAMARSKASPIHPPMPAALGPSCLGIYCCVRQHPRLPVFLVPHSPAGAKQGGVPGATALADLSHGSSSPTISGAREAADLSRQPLGQSTHPPLEGAPRREASLLILSDHGRASGSSVLGHTPSSEAARFGASPDEVFYL
jgi:hypothetical protein